MYDIVIRNGLVVDGTGAEPGHEEPQPGNSQENQEDRSVPEGPTQAGAGVSQAGAAQR